VHGVFYLLGQLFCFSLATESKVFICISFHKCPTIDRGERPGHRKSSNAAHRIEVYHSFRSFPKFYNKVATLFFFYYSTPKVYERKDSKKAQACICNHKSTYKHFTIFMHVTVVVVTCSGRTLRQQNNPFNCTEGVSIHSRVGITAEKGTSREEPQKNSKPPSTCKICISSYVQPATRNCRMKHIHFSTKRQQ